MRLRSRMHHPLAVTAIFLAALSVASAQSTIAPKPSTAQSFPIGRQETGEEPSIEQPPALIPFTNWAEVSRPFGSLEYLVTFPSPVVTGIPENDTVTLRVFLPENRPGPVPVVLIFHFWGAADLRVERAMASELNTRGVAAAVMTLPYHLERTPAGKRSGELAIEPDPKKLRATMAQSVQDARRAIDFLTQRPELAAHPLGLSGTSLGALVTANTYALDSRVTHASFLLGGVDIARILWTSSRVVPQREVLRRQGFTEEKMREELLSIEPLTHLPSRAPGTTFVIGALYDTVIPRRNTEQLVEALEQPRVLWIDTGHYGGIFVQRRLVREIATFFAEEFESKRFDPPKRLYAPTIRIGFKFDTPNGIDLGIGVDLAKFDPKGDGFMTLLVTPRGPDLFVGRRIAQGLSVGASASRRGLGIGFLWSTVL